MRICKSGRIYKSHGYSHQIFKVLKSLEDYQVFEKIILQFPRSYQFYVCGGIVRDAIAQRKSPPNDVDIIVTGADKSRLFNVLNRYGFIRQSLRNIFFKWQIGNIAIDIWRADDSILNNGLPTIENALEAFDLTCNAIAMNLKSWEIIDPVKGIEAVKNRMVDIIQISRPENIIWRILFRAIKYASKLGFTLTENSKTYILKNVYTLKEAPVNELSTLYFKIPANDRERFDQLFKHVTGKNVLI